MSCVNPSWVNKPETGDAEGEWGIQVRGWRYCLVKLSSCLSKSVALCLKEQQQKTLQVPFTYLCNDTSLF